MFGKGKFRSRLFLSWVASYFLILLLPLILCAPVFWTLKENIRRELYQSREAALWQFYQVFDQRLGDVKNLALQISLLGELNAVRRSGSDVTAGNIYSYYLLQQELKEMRSAQSFVKRIYFYVSKSDILLSESYLYHASEIREIQDNAEALLMRDYIMEREVDRLSAPAFFIDTRQNQYGMVMTYLVYAYPVSEGSGDVVLIVINTQELRNILTSSLYDRGGGFYITDGSSVLSLNDNIPCPADLDFSALAQQGTLDFNENQVAYTALSLPNQQNGWQYIHIFENDLIKGAAQSYLLLYVICLGVSILVGCLLSYFFARRNYHPVQALGRMFQDNREKAPSPPADEEPHQDEMAYIIRQVQSLQEKSEEAQQLLAQQEEQLREAILIRTMRGEISKAQQEQELIANGFSLDETACMVFLAGFPSREGGWKPEEPETFFADNLPQVGTEVYTAQMEPGTMAILLMVSRSVEEYEGQMEAAIRQYSAFVRKKYPGSICGCSSACIDLQKLSAAYAEAEMVLDYNRSGIQPEVLFYQEKGSPFSFSELQRISAAEYAYLSCVRLRNFEGAQNCLEQVMEAQKDVGIPLSRIRLNGLINLMLATTAEAAAQFRGEERQELESLATELLHCRRVPDVWETAQRLFRFLARTESSDDEQHRNCGELLEAAKQYIEEHYSDGDLSVTMTADQVGISASYLTQLFKKYCGHSTADYIHMTRLSHAKSLLDQHRIKEVAEQVGYQDVRSLIRVFKKYEGKTPSRFRDAERPNPGEEP